jgi:hypothetical protein
MSPVLAVSGAAWLVTLSVLGTVVLLTMRARRRYARCLTSFRCRLGPPTAGPRRGRAQWCLRRTQASWIDGVLLIRSGALRLWLTPLSVGVHRGVELRALRAGEVRGLGPRPVAMRFVLADGRELDMAVANGDADRMVGPFLTVALIGLPDAPRRPGS